MTAQERLDAYHRILDATINGALGGASELDKIVAMMRDLEIAIAIANGIAINCRVEMGQRDGQPVITIKADIVERKS